MIVYKITNTANDKVYIGKTTRTLARRWQEHLRADAPSMLISRAIKKYGALAFQIEVLYEAESLEELEEAERRFIFEYKANDQEKGYNLTAGGDGGPSWKGKTHTEETRQKISQACKGLKRSNATRRKISEFRKQFKYSAEARAKISGSKSGLNHPLYRKHHSPETIEKMRLSALARWNRQKS
jgi:group I intron endonuclease